MTQRINYSAVAPGGFKAMLQLQTHVDNCGLEHSLLELIKMRVSQLNRCAFCLDMHSKDARAAGETEQRLYLLNAWHEAPCYTPRERAALAWAEALTELPRNDVPDALYEEVRSQFSEQETVELSYAIIAINGWNRLGVGFRTETGNYQPQPR